MFQTTIAYFMRGGPCMWPLLLCSMAVVFIAEERILYYRKVISPEAFVLQFCQLMNAGKRKEARDMAGCRASGKSSGLSQRGHRSFADAGAFGDDHGDDGDFRLDGGPDDEYSGCHFGAS